MSARRILTVEDDPVIAKILSLRLYKLGYSVLGNATSADDAFIMAVEANPDLVIMDIGLEGRANGIIAGKYLYHFFSKPIVFCTAYSGSKVVENAKQAMPLGFIVKPFNDKDLFNAIEFSLNAYNSYRPNNMTSSELQDLVNLDLSIMFLDTSGRIIYYNPYSEHITGIPYKKAFFMNIQKIIEYDHKSAIGYQNPSLFETIREVSAIGRPLDIVVKTLKSGKRKVLELNARPRKDSHNNIIGYMIKLEEDFVKTRALNQ